jgi:hypothetical protein
MCERAEVRYVHVMTHPDFDGELEVGCVCAGRMEEDYKAAEEREADLKRLARKVERETRKELDREAAWRKLLAQTKERMAALSAEIEAAQSWVDAADEILAKGGLSEREEEFVRDMRRRAEHDTLPEVTRRYNFSEKQIGWFRAIYLRVVNKAA